VKFLETVDDVSISALLHKALTTVEAARPVANLHASALTRTDPPFCPREVVLCKKLDRKPYPQTVAAPMTVTFHEGRDTQARFNNYWMRNRMVGDWQCQQCGSVSYFCKAPLKCYLCKSKDLDYKEVIFYHPSGAQGSLDAIMDVGKKKLRLVEVKIMAIDEWVKLKAPLAEHRARSKLYLELIAGSDHPQRDTIDTQRIHILYKLRGYGKKDEKLGIITPFKEFVVERNSEEVAVYLDMATAVTTSRGSEWAMIPAGICATMLDTRAKSCCVVKDCFSGKYPANFSQFSYQAKLP
jgi:hypothetical protein